MSVVPHDFSFESVSEPAPAPRRVSKAHRALGLLKWVPRIIVNLFLVGVLGLVVVLMWAPGYIGANEHKHREFRRPPGDRVFWFNRGPRDGRWGPNRPERPNPR